MAKAKVKLDCKPAVRTSAGLRDVLFDELDSLRNGTSSATKSNAVAKLASGLVDTVRLDMEVQKHVRALGEQVSSVANVDQPFATPLKLGA